MIEHVFQQAAQLLPFSRTICSDRQFFHQNREFIPTDPTQNVFLTERFADLPGDA